jgi:ABC-type nitrate/sulfonate/bicarbonate transport system permease component
MRQHATYGAVGLGILTLLGLIAAVEVLVRLAILDPYIVPRPSDVFGAVWRVVTEEDLPSRFLLTMGETFAAALLLAVVGIPIGVALYYWGVFRAAVETWIAALAAAPIVLMYPLFLVIFGRSATTIIAIGFLAALPAVILKMGESLSLSPRQRFLKILFPAALPTIFVGLRLGLIFALINIVGVEFLINFGGLGQLVNELAERYDLPGTYAAIGFVILVSILVFFATAQAERWLRRVH